MNNANAEWNESYLACEEATDPALCQEATNRALEESIRICDPKWEVVWNSSAE